MLELVLRVVFSLSVVLGLLWLIARFSSRRLRTGTHHGLVRTLARQPLARGSSLSVLRVGERVLVVGVTEQQVNLLAELGPAELPAQEETPGGSAAQPPVHPSDPGAAGGAVAGSVLSAQTWKQAFAAATKRHGNES